MWRFASFPWSKQPRHYHHPPSPASLCNLLWCSIGDDFRIPYLFQMSEETFFFFFLAKCQVRFNLSEDIGGLLWAPRHPSLLWGTYIVWTGPVSLTSTSRSSLIRAYCLLSWDTRLRIIPMKRMPVHCSLTQPSTAMNSFGRRSIISRSIRRPRFVIKYGRAGQSL